MNHATKIATTLWHVPSFTDRGGGGVEAVFLSQKWVAACDLASAAAHRASSGWLRHCDVAPGCEPAAATTTCIFRAPQWVVLATHVRVGRVPSRIPRGSPHRPVAARELPLPLLLQLVSQVLLPLGRLARWKVEGHRGNVTVGHHLEKPGWHKEGHFMHLPQRLCLGIRSRMSSQTGWWCW